MSTEQYSTFFVDGYFFGVEVSKVQEVLKFQEMTNVPMAPDVVGGLINLRGQIVTAIDLRKRLELKDRPSGSLPLNMVIRDAESAVSLLVDEIGDVITVPSEDFEHWPENLDKTTKKFLKGVYKLKQKLLLILDTHKVTAIDKEN